MPDVDLKPLEEMFRAKVFAMLKEEGKIDDDIIRKSTDAPPGVSTQIYTAEEFISAITQHIQEKSFQMVRYLS